MQKLLSMMNLQFSKINSKIGVELLISIILEIVKAESSYSGL